MSYEQARDAEVEVAKVVFQSLKMNAAVQVHPLLFDQAVDIRAVADIFTGQLVVSLERLVFCEQLVDREQTVYAAEPATWWQHFRRDVFPRFRLGRWLLVRRPMKSHLQPYVFHLQQWALFPESPIKAPPEVRGPRVVGHEVVTYRRGS